MSQRHHATTAGLLLGLAANYRGKADASVFKMLCLHLPALLPASFSEISTSSVVQITALLGVGMLYQATAHRLTVEFLLEEIGRGASERDEGDRAARGGAGSSGSEGYSLAAGLGLGLIALGCGRSSNNRLLGLSDLRLEERLQRYMTGGKDKHDWVNTSITSVGATLALGLIFLKSGNRSVATRLAAPDTLFLLDYVRPDQLLVRTLARGLVMWDNVRGTWCYSLKSMNVTKDSTPANEHRYRGVDTYSSTNMSLFCCEETSRDGRSWYVHFGCFRA